MRRASFSCRGWLAVLLVAAIPCTVGRTDEPAERPAAWATSMELPGVPNLHKVNDGLYRGAQPTAEGLKELEKLGIKTVVNLRSAHCDKKIAGGCNLDLVSIPMYPWDVDDEEVAKFLQIVTDENCQPVFVHCQHGADRTGTMCAAYRVIVDGWTKQQAVDEMVNGGFGFHSIWSNLPNYIKNLDVEKIEKEAGFETQLQPAE